MVLTSTCFTSPSPVNPGRWFLLCHVVEELSIYAELCMWAQKPAVTLVGTQGSALQSLQLILHRNILQLILHVSFYQPTDLLIPVVIFDGGR